MKAKEEGQWAARVLATQSPKATATVFENDFAFVFADGGISLLAIFSAEDCFPILLVL